MNSYFKINRLFILGAGFSKEAGIPLTNELLKLLHAKAKNTQFGAEPFGQAEELIRKLKYYFPLLTITHELIESGSLCNQINLEEFLSFLAAESSFLYPTERLSEHGSKLIAFSKRWLGEIILDAQVNGEHEIPEFYFEFVKSLQNSLIISFNWDTLVEQLLERKDIKYRLQLNSKDYQSRDTEIPLIKLHGSIDWYTKNSLTQFKKFESTSLGIEASDIVRGKGILRDFYDSGKTPCIIIPNFDKINQLGFFGQMWEDPIRYISGITEVVIIGYSLRKDDFHARTFIYPELVEKSRAGNFKVKVIDFANTDDEKKNIMERFEGIEGCEFWFKGFGSEAIKFMNEG